MIASMIWYVRTPVPPTGPTPNVAATLTVTSSKK
jgi:hypothetical protein